MLSAWCFGQKPEFTVEYDKFQLSTRIRGEFEVDVTNTKTQWTMRMVAIARVPDNGKPVMMLYFSMSPKWLFNYSKLRFLVNDRLLEYQSKDIDYSAIFVIPYYDFDRIANGKTVEIQLSTFEGKLSEDTLAAFRKLVELAKPKPPPDR